MEERLQASGGASGGAEQDLGWRVAYGSGDLIECSRERQQRAGWQRFWRKWD
jgi:hypothetical protein